MQDPLSLDLDSLQDHGHDHDHHVHLTHQTLTVDPSQIEISHIQNVVVIPSSGGLGEPQTLSSEALASIINSANAVVGGPPPAKRKRRNNRQTQAQQQQEGGEVAHALNINNSTHSTTHTIAGTNIRVEILSNPNHR